MKTKPSSKVAVDEDEEKQKKGRSSRGKSRRGRSLSGSESPPHKRSSKSSKRVVDKKGKKSKASSRRRRRHRSPSPSQSLSSSSSPSSAHRRSLSCSSDSSASERSVSPPPRSRSRDVKKRKGRGKDRDRKRRKARRSTSCSSSSAASSDSSRSRSRSKNRLKRKASATKDGSARDKIQKNYDNSHSSRSKRNMAEDVDVVQEDLATAKMGNSKIDWFEKNVSLEKVVSPPSKDVHETEDILPAGSGSPVAEDLELILRQKALENFRRFKAAAAKAGKTDNGATGKEALSDSPQSAGAKIAEARSASITPFQRQRMTPGVRHSAGSRSPRTVDCENLSHSWKRENSSGMSLVAGSPGVLEPGGSGGPTQQKGSTVEATRSTSELTSPQYSKNSGSVMQRLSSIPGSSSSVKQRLGSSAAASHVNGAPRVRSVVSIPTREGLDGSTFTTTPPVPCDNSAPVESSSQVGHLLIDINKAEGTNGDDRKTSEASASNGSVLSPAEGKSQATEAKIEDKDSSEFQKKTFSRMHDGETVEVSYKVYIPKKTPALARRKLQR